MQAEHKYGNKTLYELFFHNRNLLVDIGAMVVAVAVLAGLANLTIPLWPVPITGQTFGIFLIAFFFGARKGAMTILLYILAGLIGIGVFASHSSGLKVLIGPTGGYIAGFLVAVYMIGRLIQKGYGRSRKSVLYCMVLGNLVIYALGLVVLWWHFPAAGVWGLLMMGVIPFLIGDAIKIAAAMLLFPYLWNKGQQIVRH